MPSPKALVKVARAALDELAAELAKADGTSSVHDARRQIKLVRSLLRLLREAVGRDAYRAANARLREAAAALAGQRRAEALSIFACKLKSKELADAAERHRQAHAGDGAAEYGPAGARQAIGDVQEMMPAWKLPRNGEALVAEVFLETYGRARKQLAHALKSRDAEELHGARKQVIHHLHHLSLLEGALRKAPDMRLARLDMLRETLGELNDLDELAKLAEENGAKLKGRTHRVVAARRRKLLKRAEKQWKPLFRHGPKSFAKRIGFMRPRPMEQIAAEAEHA